MRRIDGRLIIGVLLIAGGVFYLLENLGVVTWGRLVWAGVAALGGVVLLGGLARDRTLWWLAIPGIALLGIAGVIVLEYLNPALGSQWSGPLFLGAIGLSFWLAYALDRQMWWALIPGGVLVTLAVVAALDSVGGIETGGVFFLGLGATFAIVALAPGQRPNTRWALYPAAVLALIGALQLVGFERAMGYLWPVALIAFGGFLLLRAVRR